MPDHRVSAEALSPNGQFEVGASLDEGTTLSSSLQDYLSLSWSFASTSTSTSTSTFTGRN